MPSVRCLLGVAEWLLPTACYAVRKGESREDYRLCHKFMLGVKEACQKGMEIQNEGCWR